MLGEVGDPTTPVVMLKAGELVAPPGTVTDAGTDKKAELELERFTTNPAEGAGLASIT